MADVFISYSRKDTPFVRSLHAALEKEGREAWVDWQDIAPSALWMDEIHAAIEAADTFVFVISPDSVTSSVCADELAHAVKHYKRLIPVVRRETVSTAIPAALQAINWIFFRETDDFAASFATLLSAIDSDPQWVKAHTRLLTRALEWERRGHAGSVLLRGEDLRAAEETLAGVGPERSPQPTPLQRAYVLAGRRASTRLLRSAVGIGAAVIAVLALLAVVALIQRNRAEEQQRIAQERQAEAERQASIALSRQLAAQSQSLIDQQPGALPLAAALAIESMRRHPSQEADQALRRAGALLPQLQQIVGHDGEVTTAVFSPDDKYLITGSRDGTVRVWDLAERREMHRLTYDTPVGQVAISPDGRYIAAASDLLSQTHASVASASITTELPPDYATTIWETATGRVVARLPQTELIIKVRFSLTGESLATVGTTIGTVQHVGVWETATGRPLARLEHKDSTFVWDVLIPPRGEFVLTASSDLGFKGSVRVFETATSQEREKLAHPAAVRTLAVPDDGRYFATGAEDGIVRVYDPQDNFKEILSLRHGSTIPELAFGREASSRLLAAGDESGTVRVWEIPRGQERIRLEHEGGVTGVAFHDAGRQLLTLSSVSARNWDAATGKELTRFTHEGAGLNSAAASAAANEISDRTLIVTAGGDNTARVWELNRGGAHRGQARLGDSVISMSLSPDGTSVVASIGGTSGFVLVRDAKTLALRHTLRAAGIVTQVQFSPDSTIIATVHAGTVELWRAGDGRRMRSIQVPDLNVQHVAFSPDGTRLATAGQAKYARIWDISSGRQQQQFAHDEVVNRVAFSPDGTRLVTGSNDATARVWDVETGEEIHRLGHYFPVDEAVFSADGARIVTEAGFSHLWDAATGKELAVFPSRPTVNEIALSADGRRFAAASGFDNVDTVARVLDAATGEELHSFQHEQSVVHIAFSPNGTQLITADAAHQLHLWDLETGREAARDQHDRGITALAFTPDGQRIFTGSLDRTIRLWLWRQEDVIADLCDRGMRNLTADEWAKYLGELPRRATCADRPLP